MSKNLAFEEPVVQLREKIDELKTIAAEAEVDMSGEIEKLETRLSQLEQSIYANMKPWDRVQVARHQKDLQRFNILKQCVKILLNYMVIVHLVMMQPFLVGLPFSKGNQ